MKGVPTQGQAVAVTAVDASPPRPRPVQTQPLDVFLTAHEVIARYGWGRTKGYRMLRSDGFPRPIGGDRYRLDTLIAWEDAQLHSPPKTAAAPTLPRRKRAS